MEDNNNIDLLSTTFDCSKYGNAKSNGMYVKYFIAFDVRSVHILRIQENINADYEYEEGYTLLEHELIDYFPKIIRDFEEKYNFDYEGDDRLFISQMIKEHSIVEVLKTIADIDEENGYENWDYNSFKESVDTVVNREIIGDFSSIHSITI